MTEDMFAEFKNQQRAMWSSFAPSAVLTTPVAGHLIEFAGIAPGEKVLDVACGTGVVAITAARRGATVSALDLTPALLEHARENEKIAECGPIDWTEGDAERLPYPDDSFDVVLSQFGHMFAPRPDVALGEMRRVLKSGGRIAFATWPPEHFVGRFFAFVARYSPAPPEGAVPPPLWGSIPVVTERLSRDFDSPFFERGVMRVPALSLTHLWLYMSASIGPLQKIVERYINEPEELRTIRQGMIELAAPYFSNNIMHQDYLLTRAVAC
ncbi:MAG TPA: methyltransferase domain-containing protein [Sphingomicrobium sp.]|nr:methyltransferase domain-containing protein [Sphingomicrobium sp.]